MKYKTLFNCILSDTYKIILLLLCNCYVSSYKVQSNIIVVGLNIPARHNNNISAGDISKMLKQKSILINDRNSTSLRIVTHRDLNADSEEAIITAFKEISDELA